MKKKNKNNKYFSIKNYLYIAVLFIIIILTFWYFFSWYKVKQEEKLMTSYLITTNTLTYEIKDLNEIVQVLKESPNEYFIYISYTNDEDVYKLEKKLKKVIDDYDLKDEFYYINITDELNDDNIYQKLNNIFNTKDINNAPCILYFKNNELDSVIIDDNGIFDYNNFINLLKDNEYEK